MQTFLPYPDFRKSLECLDNKRLGKQRVEAMQLINALERGGGAWFNHPAAQMWKHHIEALKIYHDMSIREWMGRSFKNTMKFYHDEDFMSDLYDGYVDVKHPQWFGGSDFHAAHRSNLLRKEPLWYGQFGWTEPMDLPYVWPSKVSKAA